MKVLHLLYSGGIGGTEVLCKDIAQYSSWNNCFCFLAKGGIIANEIEKSGKWVERIYKRGNSFIAIQNNLQRLQKRHKFDVIVIQHFGFSMDLHYLLLKKFSTPFMGVKILHVMYEPQYTYHGKFAIVKKYTMKKIFQNTELIIGVSKVGKESFQKSFKIPEDKMEVVYNGIGTSFLETGLNYSPKYEGVIKLVYIGRLVKEKGVDLVIKALSQLNQNEYKLVVVGDGSEREQLELITQNHALKNVKFVGFKRDTQKYLMDANVFIYPSVWEEVFGISIVEAMAYGLPCIVNRKGGIPEIVSDGVNGIITESPTSLGVRDALLRIKMLYESGAVIEMSSNARKTAENFSINNTVAELERVFDKHLCNL